MSSTHRVLLLLVLLGLSLACPTRNEGVPDAGPGGATGSLGNLSGHSFSQGNSVTSAQPGSSAAPGSTLAAGGSSAADAGLPSSGEPVVECTPTGLLPPMILASAGMQILTVANGARAFSETTVVQSNNVELGVMLWNPQQTVAAFVLNLAPGTAAADATAEELLGRRRLTAVAATSNITTMPFTAWDGTVGVRANYTWVATGAVKARTNGLLLSYLAGATGTLPVTGDVTAPTGFKVAAAYIHRPDGTTWVVMAVQGLNRNQGEDAMALANMADGSGLASLKDLTEEVCDVLHGGGSSAPVDILFAVDNSVSMGNQQAALGSAALAMGQRLSGGGLDWRAAMVTSGFYHPRAGNDGCTSAQCGDAYEFQCREFTQDSARLSRWLTLGQVGWAGAGGHCNVAVEEIMEGARLILTPGLPTQSFVPPTPGDSLKLRPGAHLAVVFMGDADDQYYGSGTPAQAGIVEYTSFFQGLVAQGTVASLTVGGILCLTPGCGETQRTPRVVQSVVSALQGVIGGLDQPAAIPAVLDAILDQAITNTSVARLTRPAITATVKVRLPANSTVGACTWDDVPQDSAQGFLLDPTSGKLVLNGACRPTLPDTQVFVSYRTWTHGG